MKKNLKGLLLVGGKSSRMGVDKALLTYRDNQPEWFRISQLMHECCDDVYVCCQKDAVSNYELPAVIDYGKGPLAAIAAADKLYPDHAWLVVACDLPLLDLDTLKLVVESRDPNIVGTYYTSAFDGKPEPLCAVYEKLMFPKIHQSIANNMNCPRDLFLRYGGKALTLQQPQALKNANTPAEKLEIEAILSGKLVTKTARVRYFAKLKELACKDGETVHTTAVTAAGLYEQLQLAYPFDYKIKQLMVAINDDFCAWETPLHDGDEVVFIPPVAGG